MPSKVEKVLAEKDVAVPSSIALKPICGKELSVAEYKVFKHWYKKGDLSKAAKNAGVPEEEVYSWANKDWWYKLKTFFFQLKRDSFYAKVLDSEQDVFKAYKRVLKGQEKDAKMLTAIVNAVKIFMEAGDDPIISKKKGNVGDITINSQHNYGDIDQNKLKNLTQEQMLEIATGGAIPDSVLKL